MLGNKTLLPVTRLFLSYISSFLPSFFRFVILCPSLFLTLHSFSLLFLSFHYCCLTLPISIYVPSFLPPFHSSSILSFIFNCYISVFSFLLVFHFSALLAGYLSSTFCLLPTSSFHITLFFPLLFHLCPFFPSRCLRFLPPFFLQFAGNQIFRSVSISRDHEMNL